MQLYNYIKNNYKEKIIITVICLIYVFVMYKMNFACIWKKLFKTICPGCGFTRALICVSRLDFQKAFYYHPLFWTLPILIYCYVGRNSKIKNLTLVVIVILFLLVWLYRLYKRIEI